MRDGNGVKWELNRRDAQERREMAKRIEAPHVGCYKVIYSARALGRCLKDVVVGRFGVALAIEEQRVVGATTNGEGVEPGIAIVDAPEGDAGDGVAVLQKYLEKIGVTFRELLLNLIGKAVGVGVETFGGIKVLSNFCAAELIGIRKDVDVEFGNVDLYAEFGERGHCGIDLGSRR